jgi:hypothetical protein
MSAELFAAMDNEQLLEVYKISAATAHEYRTYYTVRRADGTPAHMKPDQQALLDDVLATTRGEILKRMNGYDQGRATAETLCRTEADHLRNADAQPAKEQL